MVWCVGIRLGEDETKKFVLSILPPYLLTLILLAVPFFHGAAFRNLQSGLKWDLDSVCELAGLLGFYLCGVLTLIHQRLAAMEKRLAARDQQP